MKEILLAVGIKFGHCVMDCLGLGPWRRRRQARKDAAELAERQRQKQAELERRVEDACKASRDCQNYLPIVLGRTPKAKMTPAEKARVAAAEAAGHPTIIKKFGPKKGKRNGKQKHMGNKDT